MRATRAITRGISSTFHQATVQVPSEVAIDVALARRQHAAYVHALQSAGVEVTELPPLDAHADCCFVEDCALVAGGVALITRPGALSRVGEEVAVGAALARWLRVETMSAPATLDGGDCMRLGKTWFVGRTPRTNAAGAARVAEVFEPLGYRVVEVPVRDVLHLKCVCSPLDDERLVLTSGTIPPEAFHGFHVLEVPRHELYASNVLSANDTVVMAEGFPETRRIVAAAGFRVLALDVSEIRKADGSLTCMSVLVP